MAKSTDNAHARLFSSYRDIGAVKSTELVFDCDPSGKAVAGLRLICKGMIVESAPVTFDDGKYHHLAVTYDDGIVAFYLDGNPVGKANVTGGEPISMERDLRIAEDADVGGNEQFQGYLDDILVLGRTLTPEEVKKLSRRGAAVFFGLVPS
jgi:sialidase-1